MSTASADQGSAPAPDDEFEARRKKALAMGGGVAKAEGPPPENVNGHKFLGQVVEGFDPKDLRAAVDEMKKRLGSGVGALVAVNDGRASVDSP